MTTSVTKIGGQDSLLVFENVELLVVRVTWATMTMMNWASNNCQSRSSAKGESAAREVGEPLSTQHKLTGFCSRSCRKRTSNIVKGRSKYDQPYSRIQRAISARQRASEISAHRNMDLEAKDNENLETFVEDGPIHGRSSIASLGDYLATGTCQSIVAEYGIVFAHGELRSGQKARRALRREQDKADNHVEVDGFVILRSTARGWFKTCCTETRGMGSTGHATKSILLGAKVHLKLHVTQLVS
jgi:hypothetical protein